MKLFNGSIIAAILAICSINPVLAGSPTTGPCLAADLAVMRKIASLVTTIMPTWSVSGDPCNDGNWAGVTCNSLGSGSSAAFAPQSIILAGHDLHGRKYLRCSYLDMKICAFIYILLWSRTN